jgi:hypothetical protein
MRGPVDFEKEYGPKEVMPDEEEPVDTETCPFCDEALADFTFFRCEPQQICSPDGVEDLDAEGAEDLEPDVAVRCDFCFEFLPRSYYCPLADKMKGIVDAANAATD